MLKTVPLFSGLSNKDLDQIARSVDETKVQQGHVIARQGGTGREMFIILEGAARVERDGRLIARLKPSDSFGEMSLIDGEPRSATVRADKDVTLLVVESRAFLGLLDNVPGLGRRLLKTMSGRLRNADIQLASRN
jgi:CRP/FNR family transcriptional regulator/CRP/FNR family cyclic AMP-dependent transcriptional regulator